MSKEKMALFKLFIVLVGCITFSAGELSAQQNCLPKTLIGKVIKLDTLIFNRELAILSNEKPRSIIYALYHCLVRVPNGDSVLLSFVFDIQSDMEKAKQGFGVLIDSVYQFGFVTHEPCNCVLPGLYGCGRKKSNGTAYTSIKGTFWKRSILNINRIIYFSEIDELLWKQLIK
ncbi:MAG: hypothetical protein EOO06_16785 [Chitinophagaceae bacterium]|nr:MAG: hypothetical protein EOO06_16785 [Chitinophagaceae bacterium]